MIEKTYILDSKPSSLPNPEVLSKNVSWPKKTDGLFPVEMKDPRTYSKDQRPETRPGQKQTQPQTSEAVFKVSRPCHFSRNVFG